MRERGSKSNNFFLRSYNKSCGAWCGGMTDIFGISTSQTYTKHVQCYQIFEKGHNKNKLNKICIPRIIFWYLAAITQTYDKLLLVNIGGRVLVGVK